MRRDTHSKIQPVYKLRLGSKKELSPFLCSQDTHTYFACLPTHGGKLTLKMRTHGKVCYSALLQHCWLIHVGLSLAVNRYWMSLKNGPIVLGILWSRDRTQQRASSGPVQMTPALKIHVPSFRVIRTQGGQKCFYLRYPQRRFTSQLCWTIKLLFLFTTNLKLSCPYDNPAHSTEENTQLSKAIYWQV